MGKIKYGPRKRDFKEKTVYTPKDFEKLRKKLEETGLASQGITMDDVFYYGHLYSYGDPIEMIEKAYESGKKLREHSKFFRIDESGQLKEVELPRTSATELNIILLKFKKIRENVEFTNYLIEQGWLRPWVPRKGTEGE